MRRHHPTATARFAFGKIFERELSRGHSAAEDQTAVAIKRNDVIVQFHLNGDGGERFMPHAGNVKMTFALSIQILLAQIGMPALEHDREKAQLIFLAQLRHTMSILQLQLRLDNRPN